MRRSLAVTARRHCPVGATAIAVGTVAIAIATLAVVTIAVAMGAAGGVAAIDGSTTSSPQSVDDAFLQTDEIDPDRVVLEADVDEAGTAVWSIEYRIDIEQEDREAAFEDLAAEIDANESAYLDPFVERMSRTVETAEETTGRSMALENPAAETDRRELPESTGVVTYRFEWVGFAATDDDALVAGDAVAGLFFEADTRFVLRYPEGYAVESVRPEPDDRGDRSVRWDGPVEFADDEPRVVAVPEDDPTLPAGWLAGGVGLVIVLAGAVWWWLRRRPDEPPAEPTEGTVVSAEHDEATETGERDDREGPSESSATEAATDVPSELLSSEERVIRLLEANGGRMKQQEVVAAFDWSDARASQVVGELREQGKIESFRVGRENVLRLLDEDEEPGSPLEPE